MRKFYFISEKELERLNLLVGRYQSTSEKQQAGQFEWVDGILVTALKKGSWLLLKNANLCR